MKDKRVLNLLVRKILRDLSHRKLRTTLTVLGLAIAVLGITGVAISNASVIESAERAYGLNISADIRIITRDAIWNESYVTGIDGLEKYEPTYRLFTTTSLENKNRNVALWGINITSISEYQSLYGLILDEGRLPNPTQDELLIDASAAHSFELTIGDLLTITVPSDSTSEVKKIDFEISGLARAVREPGYTFTSSIGVWMSLERLQELIQDPDLINNLFFKVTDGYNAEEVSNDISSSLDRNDLFVERSYVFEEGQDIRYDLLSIMNALLSISMVIGLLIGGILTTSTVQMAIASEREDISLMKINGATKRHILLTYISEGAVLGLLGSIIGTMMSIIFAYFLLASFADPYGLSTLVFIIPETPLIAGFLIPILTSIIFSLPVIVGTIKITPMDAFRTSVSFNKSTKTKASPRFLLPTFSFSNLVRKKVRIILNLLLLIIAVGSMVGFRAAGDSAVTAVITLLDNMPGDVQITISAPENETLVTKFLNDFFSDNFPTQIDCWGTYWWFSGIEMYLTPHTEPTSMQLLGIHPESQIWDTYSKSGSWLSSDPSINQVILTELFVNRLSDDFNLSIGSEIILGTPLFNETFTIIGYIDDINNQGRMLYTSLSTLNRFLKAENLVDSVNIELIDPSLEKEVVNKLSSNEFVSARAWNVVGMSFWKEANIRQIDFLILFFSLIGLLLIVIAIIGGVNAFSMSVLEREREIGILKLIGARPRWIINSLLCEAVYVGIVASFFGILFAKFVVAEVLLSIVGSMLVPIPLSFTIDHILLGVGASLITVFLAAIYPSYQASKTSVITALKYE
ncbi:MAG: ABC transporter permease [Candidatus Hodarchaeales archaeon]|jgi:putative ABC transport system permease protein